MKPSEILRELKKYPKKLLGQNFLVDEAVVNAMIEAAELSPEEVVIEIGPGLGALTFALLTHVKQVIAIEIDYEFAHYLRLKKHPRLTVIRADALGVDWEGDKIVSNIPYSITLPLLRKVFTAEHRPAKAVLLMQKEMAERVCAAPGSRERGFLTLLVEANAEAKSLRLVKPGSFYPRPKTNSAIVCLDLLPQSKADELFWPAIEAGFRHKRQMLVNGLSRDLALGKELLQKIFTEIGLSVKIRPQELDFNQWAQLSERLKGHTMSLPRRRK